MGPANRRSWLYGDPNAKFFFEKKRKSKKLKKARKTQPTERGKQAAEEQTPCA
jgi:hypothetical protein